MFKRQAFYAKQKIGVKAIYNITTCIDFTITSEIYFLGFLERPEFQIQFFFFIYNSHGKGSLEETFATNISLVPQLSTKIHACQKSILLQPTIAASFSAASFTTEI